MNTSENISFLALLLSPDDSPEPEPEPKPEPEPEPRVESYSLDSIVQECHKKILARRQLREKQKMRRSRMRDNLFELSKLMPFKRKKTTTGLLESTYKYIKFLQAQVIALESMPVVSGFAQSGEMTRQELLEAVVNSREVQKVMADNEWVVASSEQVARFCWSD